MAETQTEPQQTEQQTPAKRSPRRLGLLVAGGLIGVLAFVHVAGAGVALTVAEVAGAGAAGVGALHLRKRYHVPGRARNVRAMCA